ncbi:MAG: BrnT family toxin [Rhodospirillales bacterium]|nr:BrnT family toxin [Rhodospirillales bacterium]
MRIAYDEAKRALTLEKRGLDFALAGMVFGDRHMTRIDDRRDYGEPRFISIGRLATDVIVLVWTPRSDARRIISMRKANGREKAYFEASLARS